MAGCPFLHPVGWVVGSPYSPCRSFPTAVLPLSSLLMLPGCCWHKCLSWGMVEMDRQTESSDPAQLQPWGTPHLTSYALLPPRLLQLGGDLEDLESALNRSSPQRVLGSGSCSALVKLLPGQRDLLVAHDTWSSYQGMLRVVKKYSLPFRASAGGAWAGPGWGGCASHPPSDALHPPCRQVPDPWEHPGILLVPWHHLLHG